MNTIIRGTTKTTQAKDMEVGQIYAISSGNERFREVKEVWITEEVIRHGTCDFVWVEGINLTNNKEYSAWVRWNRECEDC